MMTNGLFLGKWINKRGQTEILGLAIIVVIVIIGVIFSLRFMNSGDSEETKDDFVDATLSSNILNVILRTNLECSNLDMKALLQDCAQGLNNKDYCAGLGNDPCAIVADVVENRILEPSLGTYKKDYYFEATYQGTAKIKIPSQPTCTTANIPGKYKSRVFESYPVPVRGGGMMEISLAICR